MKKLLLVCTISVLCLPLFLTSCLSKEPPKEAETTTAAETTVDNMPIVINNEIEKIKNSFSSASFGGRYIENNNTIVVNLVENEFNRLSSSTEKRNGMQIIYKPVKFSLAELENFKNKLEPFMAEYKIATIDANEVTNKIDIQLYEENPEIELLVSKYIDLKYTNISILPEDYRIEFT